jgi:RHS repeat-associated protein
MPYNEAPAGSAGPSFNQSFGDVFDSHEYDSATRELHPVQGRWISPDPAGMAAVDVTNPQSWNRYAYVNNNPLSNVDPSGLLDDPSCAVNGMGCGGGGSGDASSSGNFGAGGAWGDGSNWNGFGNGSFVDPTAGGASNLLNSAVANPNFQGWKDSVESGGQVWGWMSNTWGVSAPNHDSSIVTLLAYWGVAGTVPAYEAASAFCALFCGADGNKVFDRTYPLHPRPTATVSAVAPPTKPTLQQIASWCMTATYVSMGEADGPDLPQAVL